MANQRKNFHLRGAQLFQILFQGPFLREAGVEGVVAAGFGGGAEVEEERLEADTRLQAAPDFP